MAEDDSQRTEEPSGKRRDEARAEGRVPHSVEISSSAVLFAALVIASRHATGTVDALREIMRQSLLGLSRSDLTPDQIGELLHRMTTGSAAVVAPVLGATAVAALAANIAQTGFLLVPKRL